MITKMQKLIYLIVLLFIVALLYIMGQFAWHRYKISKISDFEACVEAGFSIQEIFPPRCLLPNGKSFTQDIDKYGAACTMEARICPDGSTVGRMGSNCEFAACPIK